MNYDLWYSTILMDTKKKYELFMEYKSSKDIYEKCSKIKSKFSEIELQKLESYMILNSINIININNKDYPKDLKNIYDPPVILFYKGNINLLNSNINCAVIGSRNCSDYGIRASKLLCTGLADNKINVISGLARGIDAAAHKYTLESNGYTCAILGCGIDVIYPKENKYLYDSIISNGCILSEYPPKTSPKPYYFPKRNRIISGLSKAVIVIEAGIKSGALNTVDYALNEGKDVGAVPGTIFSDYYKGSNGLIRDGATPIFGVDDACKLLNIENKNVNKYKKNLIFLTREEESIDKLITDNPIHINDILNKTNVDIKQLYELLFELQFKNRIICLAGNYYVKVNHI